MTVIVPNNHPLSLKSSVSIEDLSKYPLIYYDQTAGTRPLIDNMFHQIGCKPNIVCEVGTDFSMIGMVESGIGISIVCDTNMINLFRVKKIPLEYDAYDRTIYVAILKNCFIGAAPQEFVKFLSISSKRDLDR